MDWNWEKHFDSRVAAPPFGVHRHEATAVLHPFGRGEFKELARKAVIPKIVLDAIVNKHGNERSWSSSTSVSATWKGGGATRHKSKMGGVNKKNCSAESKVKPKVSCRGRALKMRAEKSRMPRPGAGLPAKEQVDFRRSSVAVNNHGGGSLRSKEGRLPELSPRRSTKDDRISVASDPLLVQTHHSTQEDWNTYDSKWPSLKAANNLSCFSDAGSSDVVSDNSLHFSPLPLSTTSEESKQPVSTSRVVKDQPVDESQEKKRSSWVPKKEDTESEWCEESWTPVTITEDTTVVEPGHSQDEWTPTVTEEEDSGIEPSQDIWEHRTTMDEEVPTIEQFQDACFSARTEEADTVNEERPDIEVEISTTEKPCVANRTPTTIEEEAQGILEAGGELMSKEKESPVVELSQAIGIPTATEEVVNKPSEVIGIPLKAEEGPVNEQFQDACDPSSTEENVNTCTIVTSHEICPLTEEVDAISKQPHDITVPCVSEENVPVIEEGFAVNTPINNVPEVEAHVIEQPQVNLPHAIIAIDPQTSNENTIASPTSTVHDESASIVNEDVPFITNGLRVQAREVDEPISEDTILVEQETRECDGHNVSPSKVLEARDSQTLNADVMSNTIDERKIENIELEEMTTLTDKRLSISDEVSQECNKDAKIDECANVVEERHSNRCDLVMAEKEDSENVSEDIDVPTITESDVNKPISEDISQEECKSMEDIKNEQVEDGGEISDTSLLKLSDERSSVLTEDTEVPGYNKMDKKEVVEELLANEPNDHVKTELRNDDIEEETIMSDNEQSLPQDQNVSADMKTSIDSDTHAIVESQIKDDVQPVDTSLDNPPNNSNAVHNICGQDSPIAKEDPSGIQTDSEPLKSIDACSISTLAIVCAAGPNQEESLDWSLDNQSLCFGNLPSYVTEKELEQMIEPFGSISHCKVLRETHDNSTSTVVAYVRMEKKSACSWVISCFHGSPYDDSPLHIQCNYAVAGEATDYMIENFDV